ncbi:hypothetical protein LS77_002570 [Helicobacter bilis]|uniref:Uncharacterized protein n=2 Tax=Helicobacter bilis TaxID=37372 RepID=A0A6D2CHS4_9HELI|nr:hypothetical protein [Helicobacter bilis]EMZ38280.1 hypothetical protein C826_01793 [Helicobacter bilis WiWa]TLE05596.1 hypothetical protein LS77_002570 [Helicobacter bilis]TLE06804.1 hypothetical protein LS76_001440 [Helicobacter bilis]
MIENKTNSITKDYHFYLSCSKEELGKLYRNNAIKEKRLNKKIQDMEKEIKEIEKINTLLTKAMTAKNKDINKNLTPLKETISYKSAMKYKASLSLDEQQKIINEVNDEINRKYDDE